MVPKPTYEELEQRVKILTNEAFERDLTEKEVERIFNFSIDMIGSGNLKGYFTKINSSFGKLLGYSEKEILERPFIKFVHEDDVEKTKQALADAARGKKEIYIENRYKCKDGSYKWIEWKVLSIVKENKFIAVGRDVTERKRRDEVLRRTKERFRNLTEMTSDWIWEVDEDACYTYASPKVKEMLGYDPEEIIGKTPFDLMPPEEAKRIIKIFNNSAASQEPFDCLENVNLHKKGYRVVIETSGTPIFSADGVFLGYRGVDRNITNRKQTEKELRESEERFRTIFKNSSDGIIVADPETMKFLYVNPAICKILGYTEEELTQMGVVDIHPKKSLEYVVSEFKTLAWGEKLLAANIPFLKKNKTIIYMDVNTSIVRMGEKIKIMGILRDVTERKLAEEALKKSEERYRALAENSQVGFWHITLDGHPIYINPAMCQMLEVESPEELSGQTYESFFDGRSREIIKRELAKREKGISSSYEVKLIGKKGTKRNVIISGSPLFSSSEKLHSTIGTLTDITDQKKAEEALKKAHDELERKVKERTHELLQINERLKESEASLKSILQSAPIGIGVVQNRVIQEANERFCKLLGYSSKEILGNDARMIYPTDEDYEYVGNEKYAQIRAKGIGAVETRLRRKNGKIINVLLSSAPIDAKDLSIGVTFTALAFTALDVTDRKQAENELRKSEQKYRLLVESTPDWVWICDKEGRHTFSNKAVKKILGYEVKEVLGVSAFSLMHPKECKRVQKWFQNAKKEKRGWSGTIICWRHKDKSIRFLETIAEPILDDQGNLNGFTGIDRDVTERKQSQEELKKAHNKLQKRTMDLEIKTKNLEEINIAMKILLQKREEDKKDIEHNILTNVKKLIDPYINKIRKTKLDSHQNAFLNIMESNLQEITSQFARKVSLSELNLTPTELQIANMIRYGNSSKEIAGMMNISIRTVDAHRRNIRKKIGLTNKRANLRSHLLSLH